MVLVEVQEPSVRKRVDPSGALGVLHPKVSLDAMRPPKRAIEEREFFTEGANLHGGRLATNRDQPWWCSAILANAMLSAAPPRVLIKPGCSA